MIHVLFVCLGNICRSPMGEAVFRHLVDRENLADKITVDSAGTASWHTDKLPHDGTRKVLEREGISYEGMKARQVSLTDFKQYDYIVVMDEQNMIDLISNYEDIKGPVLAKLLDFAEDTGEVDVPDPYYTGDFNYTYDLVLNGTENLLTHIRIKHNI